MAPCGCGGHRHRRFPLRSRNPFERILRTLDKPEGGEFGKYYSLPDLDDPRYGLCKSIFSNLDHKSERDFTGVPAVVDLACMRSAISKLGGDSNKINPLGFAVPKDSQSRIVDFSFHDTPARLRHGDVIIAAITSCTNTSNPSVMLASALVAKKACDLGLELCIYSGLLKYLKQLGFHLVGYGYTTCIGNSGDLDESVASVITENDIVAAAVLSGNRNFEGCVHPLTRANYLVSPTLVVVYALAGTVNIDFETEPVGLGKDGNKNFFRDIWPSSEEVSNLVESNVLPAMFKATYEAITKGDTLWSELPVPSSTTYEWEDPKSTYIKEPLYLDNISMSPPGPCGVKDAYCFLNFGDSITTDHISPSGSIHIDSPAAKYLMEHEVDRKDFNSYGSRRGNDEVMVRGTFANILTSNLTGMGIIPLCFKPGEDADTLGLTGHERYTIDLPSNINEIRPGQDITVVAENGKSFTCTLRFDTELAAIRFAVFDLAGQLSSSIHNESPPVRSFSLSTLS
ncbi:hypothetical protein RJ640_028618 [Escallonia rubra]|uniref:Aconitase/3-isopropylmalate dehydratase large subunit alpha/beta/alpha domain-containing protein n=1 Tax=Escallonia rubra TaxID=112253 RepID=A0AA88UG58_9ASTE|nr:hypothetical protein RJ640_028618 [Escallonia rubra]